jgi:prepilin-type processing-associated H-X9-DG protein
MPAYTVATIPDGTSNTMFLSEHSAVSLQDGMPKVMVYGPDNGGLPMDCVLPLFNYVDHETDELPSWSGTSVPPGIGTHFWMPQFNPTGVSGRNPATYRMVQGYHPDRLNVGMGDGSVRSIANGEASTAHKPWAWPRMVYPCDGMDPSSW